MPDEVLALAFMVDLDNDGIVSWTDFYSFAVLAEQVTTATCYAIHSHKTRTTATFPAATH